MLWPYLKIWDWDLIFGNAVRAISSPGVRSPWIVGNSGYASAVLVRVVQNILIELYILFINDFFSTLSKDDIKTQIQLTQLLLVQAEYWDTYDYVNETNTMVAEIERANRVHKLHVTLKLNESSDQGTIHN